MLYPATLLKVFIISKSFFGGIFRVFLSIRPYHLHILNNKGNANQNYVEMSQNGYHQETINGGENTWKDRGR
jgi:hypothetical protein